MIHWRVWTDAKTEQKARAVLQRLLATTPLRPSGLTVAPYPKTGGYVLSFTSAVSAERWADLVLETLTLGQQVGRSWHITGEASSELSGWSNEARGAGVASISWDVVREGLP